MIKTLIRVCLGGRYLSIIKTINDTPTTNIILNWKKLKQEFLKQETRECPHSLLLFSIVLEILARLIRQEQETKGKEEIKLTIFRWYDFVYRNSKEKTETVLGLNSFSKVAGYKINIQKSVQQKPHQISVSFFTEIEKENLKSV